MTDSQIAAIRKGEQFRDREGVRWTASSDARLEVPATTNQTHQVYLRSASGNQSVRLTYRNATSFERIFARPR